MPDKSPSKWSKPWLRRRASEWRERPFVRLVEHFLARLARGGHEAESTEFQFGAGPLLGILAAPGAFSALLLFQKYSSLADFILGRRRTDIYSASIPDKYFFISLGMGIAGIVTALKWDRILPDSQDYLNLAPLPLRPRTVLQANAVSIAIAVLIVAIALNGISSALFPLVLASYSHLSFSALAQFGLAHAETVVLATLFACFAVFALLGILAAILPRNAFRACSSWVRGGALIASVMLIVTGSAGPALLRGLQHAPASLARFLPTLWYLGLEQTLQRHTSPVLKDLANRGIWAVWIAAILMAASYGFSYRRRYQGIMESSRRASGQRAFPAALVFPGIFTWRASPFVRACYRFVVRAMLRNEAHRMAIAAAAGLGWTLAIQEASTRTELSQFAGPLIAAYLLVLGLRIAFELPASVPGNWVFRTVLDARETEPAGVARRVMFGFLLTVVILPAFAWSWWRSGFAMSLIQSLYTLALSLCLIEIFLAGYRKIPLTCPVPGFRDNLLALCVVQVVAFELFTQAGARLERAMFGHPWTFVLLPICMYAGWRWNLARLKGARAAGELEEGITFESAPPAEVEVLNLLDAG